MRSSNPSSPSLARRFARRGVRVVLAVWNLRTSLLKNRSMGISLAHVEPFGFRLWNGRYRCPGHPDFRRPQLRAKTGAGFPNGFSIFFSPVDASGLPGCTFPSRSSAVSFAGAKTHEEMAGRLLTMPDRIGRTWCKLLLVRRSFHAVRLNPFPVVSRMDRTISYTEGQLIVSADRLTLIRGKQTAFSTPLQEIREFAIEDAKAFSHPRLGFAFALALLVPAGWLLVTALQGAPGILFTRLGSGVLLGIGFGGWVLYEVLTSPRIYWLRVRTTGGGQRLALPGVSPAELEKLVSLLRRTASGGA